MGKDVCANLESISKIIKNRKTVVETQESYSELNENQPRSYVYFIKKPL